ncbi:hypothetical protein KPG71_14770 [Roseovarius sp. PS-C2]|uniref:hypothetical protein n=1 Tax=Roseovarius sp. PS-C2 TaxID=2820814 RepID=UPI001C0D277F|nr:hypothetical protein [Roseovarius sp. PS-C2]MBU3261285.1 hypothetical protein [Roseovarius sp. PS-C2]
MLYKTGVLSDWFQYALQTKAVIGTAAANSHFVRIPAIGTMSGRYPDLNCRGLPRRAIQWPKAALHRRAALSHQRCADDAWIASGVTGLAIG